LYVLRCGNQSDWKVDVYNITTYSLLRELSLRQLKNSWDITLCRQYRCWYISDPTAKFVFRVALNGQHNRWVVRGTPAGLSVTSQFTVLVSCRSEIVKLGLIEFTTDGRQLREISLQLGINSLQHAIQLSSGQFVVCHSGGSRESLHRVCIVDGNGNIKQSYGGTRGSATVGQLNVPYHLAVDNDEFLYVADSVNSRVLLLSPTLNFVREIVSRDQLKGNPWRLFLEVDSRRLYVAEWSGAGRVVVVQL